MFRSFGRVDQLNSTNKLTQFSEEFGAAVSSMHVSEMVVVNVL